MRLAVTHRVCSSAKTQSEISEIRGIEVNPVFTGASVYEGASCWSWIGQKAREQMADIEQRLLLLIGDAIPNNGD